jgi:Xaa-Pro aminopeptidase
MDIAAELDFQMRMLGAEKPAFETIVASGTRTALPHAHPTAKKIVANELLLIDMGATLDGYDSDMTRMSFLGVPSKRVNNLYKAVLEAQLAGIAAVKAGSPGSAKTS